MNPEDIDSEERKFWMIKLNESESKYYKKRWKFKNRIERYSRQSPYSSCELESDLIEDLKELSRIKDSIKMIRSKILEAK